jgi:hypothetical protein
MDYTSDGMNIYFNQQWVDYTGLRIKPSILTTRNVHGTLGRMLLQTMLSIPLNVVCVKRR